MKEQDRGGFFVWRSGEHGVIAAGMDAANNARARGFVDAQALAGNGNATIGIDAGARALAPNIRPPGAARRRAQDRAFLAQGEVPCGRRSGSNLTMFFAGVMVMAQLIQEPVGLRQSGNLLCAEKGRKAFLPEVVGAFDLALGLRSGGKAQGDFIETQGCAKLGESLRLAGEEEGVVIDV